MTKAEFRQKISELLSTTLDDGPGPHAVALMTGDALARFIMNEAAPAAIDDVIEHMRGALEAACGKDEGNDRTRQGRARGRPNISD
jgi:hypothetical protein